MIRSFDGRRPQIHKDAFVHDSAEVIGQVLLAKGVSVWPMVVIRGDDNRIEIGERSNIQDATVVHCRDTHPTIIGKGVTVGHGVILHGCRIGDRCLIGMGAIVMESEIGPECIIGAGAMVPKGLKVPARSLVLGFPAKVARPLKPAELKELAWSEKAYLKKAQVHKKTSRVLF